MTTDEVREYLKSYRNYKDRVTYIENKAIGRIGEPTIKNDYIVMKEECKKEMENIRNTIDKVTTLKYRMALYYRYIDSLETYEVAEIMSISPRVAEKYYHEGIAELANILE
ncbi:hypothetical protein [uncultured Catenibacterium sp.]|uniref:hypothetical protein n=1 Tax=uncultured Catenibacterium sp. TaxID=286142 RepID=UPI00258E0E17|nr:hypothetical protein [uncultured Catenibacterium sp.]